MFVLETEESNVFSWPKKIENEDLGHLVTVASHWNFLGKVEISETSILFPENKFEPKNQVVL